MFGSNVLDVALGLALVYLLMSLATSAVRESLAGMWKTRARYLERGLEELFHGDTDLLKDFFAHPQIYPLYEGTNKRPSYIPAKNFAMALLDMAARGRNTNLATQAGAESTPLTIENARRYVSGIGNPRVQRMLLTAIETSQGDLARAQKSIEDWFNSAMDRVSGRYRRRTSWVLFLTGAIATIILNVDTIRVGTAFYRSPALRDAAVAMAGNITPQRRPGDTTVVLSTSTANAALDSLYAMHLPIGWKEDFAGSWPHGSEWVAVRHRIATSFFGWLLTAFALSLGAPFWFDMLNKIMIIRSTVKPGEKSRDAKSDDKDVTADSGRAPPPPPPPAPPPAAPQAPPPQVVVVTSGAGIPGAGDPHGSANSHEWASGDAQGGIL